MSITQQKGNYSMCIDTLKLILFQKIDTSGDNIISQNEIDDFKKENPTIPLNGLEEGMTLSCGDEISLGNTLTPPTSSQLKANSTTISKDIQTTELHDQLYQQHAFKFKNNKDFESAFEKALNLAKKDSNFNLELFFSEFNKRIPNTQPIEIMKNLNSGKFKFIPINVQDIIFEDVDLSQYENAFRYMHFNEKTFANVSPEHLPKDFNPQEVLEKGKTIGLGIDEVHKMGYTGTGISYAIIDSGVVPHNDLNYKEYNVAKSAKNISWLNHFHGSAVSYIAQEIAPEADCYYYATNNGGDMNKPVLENLKSILEKNKTLPENQRIRFVSMSMPLYGGKEAKQVVAELEAQGVWVYYSGCPEDQNRGYLEKINPNGDPNDFNNYRAITNGTIFVNSGNRTVPDPSSPNAYRHDSEASQSWSIPVIAGYYTLACQADPSMTKERFMELAEQTAYRKNAPDSNNFNPPILNRWVYQTTQDIKIIDIRALLKAINTQN